jgi:hypothetical protein
MQRPLNERGWNRRACNTYWRDRKHAQNYAWKARRNRLFAKARIRLNGNINLIFEKYFVQM